MVRANKSQERPSKDVQAEFCHTSFKLETTLVPNIDSCITTIDGEIFFSESYSLIGRIQLLHLDIETGEGAGYSLHDIFDTSGETWQYFHALVNSQSNTLRESVERLSGEMFWNENILVLNRLEILPAFRGKNIGLAVLHDSIRRFGSDCALAVMIPAPLQFRQNERHNEGGRDWVEKMRYGDMTASDRMGRHKLRRYYNRLGFRRVPKTDVMILNPMCLAPVSVVLNPHGKRRARKAPSPGEDKQWQKQRQP